MMMSSHVSVEGVNFTDLRRHVLGLKQQQDDLADMIELVKAQGPLLKAHGLKERSRSLDAVLANLNGLYRAISK